MNLTKHTTYSWCSATNVSAEQAIKFANLILTEVSSNGSLTAPKFEIAPRASTFKCTWDSAKRFVNELNVDGKTGWRLPTKEELNQIYQSENDFTDDHYWTSTIGRNGAWTQHMVSGYQDDCVTEYRSGCVRAVRSPDVITNSSSTTLRFETAPKKSEIQCRWSEAQEYLENLTIDGKSGWRLPTKDELNEIYRHGNDFEKAWYWTANTDGRDFAYSLYMGNGNQGCFGGEYYKEYYVRVVRDV
jgi:hypothetical protein